MLFSLSSTLLPHPSSQLLALLSAFLRKMKESEERTATNFCPHTCPSSCVSFLLLWMNPLCSQLSKSWHFFLSCIIRISFSILTILACCCPILLKIFFDILFSSKALAPTSLSFHSKTIHKSSLYNGYCLQIMSPILSWTHSNQDFALMQAFLSRLLTTSMSLNAMVDT